MGILEEDIQALGGKLVKVVRFCTDEVERQRAEPPAVCWMLEAWLDAIRAYERTEPFTIRLGPDLLTLARWAKLIEPEKNRDGFRSYMVRVGSQSCPHPAEVPTLMAQFHAEIPARTPEENYLAFETIHPFGDGNGRTGKILYNWLKQSLFRPQMPPNFFGCSNP